MRGKKAIINTVMSLVEEFVAIICGFILPRLILSRFGSAYNGLTSSITQFLSCAVLLRSGIGGATKAALYKPLVNNNKKQIDSIIRATDIFMKKIGLVLAICILFFAGIYPLFVNTQFSWLFTFSLFVIIGISTFAESFFGITYLILLQADQKLYISSAIKCICYILNTLVASILILTGNSIHIVKLGSAISFALYPILLNIYVRKKYKINKNVEPNNNAIKQRWDAFWHQVAAFVNNNTDVMVLTIFSNIMMVSVYSVYNLVIHGLKRFITAFTNGIDAAFGNMIAKGEEETLRENLSVIELIVYSLSTLIFSCASILVLQFVEIYTKGITDVNYMQPTFSYILIAAQFLYAIRLPYQFVTNAAGHFKETKKYAIIEAIINIVLSIILVIKFGLIGVAIGTFVALAYKTIMFSNYMSNNIVKRKKSITFYKILISVAEFLITYLIVKIINYPITINYSNWIVNALITASVSTITICVGIVVFYKKDFKNLKRKLKNIKLKGGKK